jgi:hypothetical protein
MSYSVEVLLLSFRAGKLLCMNNKSKGIECSSLISSIRFILNLFITIYLDPLEKDMLRIEYSSLIIIIILFIYLQFVGAIDYL